MRSTDTYAPSLVISASDATVRTLGSTGARPNSFVPSGGGWDIGGKLIGLVPTAGALNAHLPDTISPSQYCNALRPGSGFTRPGHGSLSKSMSASTGSPTGTEGSAGVISAN